MARPQPALSRLTLHLLLLACWGVGHVECGQLVGGGGGAVGHSRLGGAGRRGGYGRVHDWPFGFFISGSSLYEMNGLYERIHEVDNMMLHETEVLYRNVDTAWTLAHVQVEGYYGVGGRPREWLIMDADGRDRFGHAGGKLLPGQGEAWQHVDRVAFTGFFKPGDTVKTRKEVDGFWERGAEGMVEEVDVEDNPKLPITLRLYREGEDQLIATQAWQLTPHPLPYIEDGADGKSRREHLDELPWQVVGIMQASTFEELRMQKRAYDQSLRAKLGAPPGQPIHEYIRSLTPTDAGGCAKDIPGLKTAEDACAAFPESGVEMFTPVLEETRGKETVLTAVVLAARAKCQRVGGAFERALTDAEEAAALAPRLPAAAEQRALSLLDVGLHDEAIRELETLLALDRSWPGLEATLLHAHARARALKRAPVAYGYYVGDEVGMVATYQHRWRRGDAAKIVGLGTYAQPFAVMIERTEELINMQHGHFRRPEVNAIGPGVDHEAEVRAAQEADVGVSAAERAAAAVARGASRAAAAEVVDPYNVLELHTGCSEKDIRGAYRTLSRKLHPDKGGDTDRYQAVSAANNVLGEPVKRRAFDQGTDLPRVHVDEVPLAEQIRGYYFPERVSWQAFGDPFKIKRGAMTRLDAEEARARAAEEQRLEAEEARKQREAAAAAEAGDDDDDDDDAPAEAAAEEEL